MIRENARLTAGERIPETGAKARKRRWRLAGAIVEYCLVWFEQARAWLPLTPLAVLQGCRLRRLRSERAERLRAWAARTVPLSRNPLGTHRVSGESGTSSVQQIPTHRGRTPSGEYQDHPIDQGALRARVEFLRKLPRVLVRAVGEAKPALPRGPGWTNRSGTASDSHRKRGAAEPCSGAHAPRLVRGPGGVSATLRGILAPWRTGNPRARPFRWLPAFLTDAQLRHRLCRRLSPRELLRAAWLRSWCDRGARRPSREERVRRARERDGWDGPRWADGSHIVPVRRGYRETPDLNTYRRPSDDLGAILDSIRPKGEPWPS